MIRFRLEKLREEWWDAMNIVFLYGRKICKLMCLNADPNYYLFRYCRKKFEFHIFAYQMVSWAPKVTPRGNNRTAIKIKLLQIFKYYHSTMVGKNFEQNYCFVLIKDTGHINMFYGVFVILYGMIHTFRNLLMKCYSQFQQQSFVPKVNGSFYFATTKWKITEYLSGPLVCLMQKNQI